MHFFYMSVSSMVVCIFTRFMVLGMFFYDSTRSSFKKMRTTLKLAGMNRCADNHKNVVNFENSECVSDNCISNSELESTGRLEVPSYDTEESGDDVYEDSLSEQETSSSSETDLSETGLWETDLSETRSCDSGYSPRTDQMQECSGPVEICSPVYSSDESDTKSYDGLGFMKDDPNSNDDDKTHEIE